MEKGIKCMGIGIRSATVWEWDGKGNKVHGNVNKISHGMGMGWERE